MGQKRMRIYDIEVVIIEHPISIYGLSYMPQLKDYPNHVDSCSFTRWHSKEITKKSFDLVKEISKEFMTDGIMEIGVHRNDEESFTNALLHNKPDHIPYFGVDLCNKDYLNNKEKNIYTLKSDSRNQEYVREEIKKIGMNKISILFIDGDHSVNTIINDWKYTDLLSEKAIVFIHDTNGHPGPVVLLDAIDKKLFEVKKYFEYDDDFGLSTAIKK